MIARHIQINKAHKSSVSSLVNYLTDSQGKKERVGAVWCANCISEETEDVVREIINTQQINKRATSSKTYHLLISFHKEDNPTEDVMKAIEARICEELGYGEHQRISVVHNDTDNPHIHVAINKIHPEKYTSHTPKSDYRILLKVSEALQKEYGLKQDNHEIKKPGAYSKALDMENKAGLQSFMGWMQENCLEQLKSAKDWNEIHAQLNRHHVELKERGNGFVFMAKDGTTIKASLVDRALSKNNLVKRLGVYKPSSPNNNPGQRNASKKYRKKPFGLKNNQQLYDQYCAEQDSVVLKRDELLTYAKENRGKKIDSIIKTANLKRRFIKNMPRGVGRRVMYWAIYHEQKREIERTKKQYLVARKQLYKKYSRTTWTVWQESKQNNQNRNRQRAI